MAIPIVIPRLGWSMDEGTFVEWLKKDGDRIEAGDLLFVIEGDKAQQEVESFDEGILRIAADAPQAGDDVQVGQLLGYLVARGESPPTSAPTAAPPVATPPPAAAPKTNKPAANETMPADSGERAFISPRAKRLARELGVDLQTVTGSGKNGRITESDVRQAADQPSE